MSTFCRRSAWLVRCLLYAAFVFAPGVVSASAEDIGVATQGRRLLLAPRPSPRRPQLSWDEPNTLGVHVINPFYAVVPVIYTGRRNVTVSLTIWLRRVGGARGPFDMEHQSRDAIRMLVWVDNPLNLHRRVYGHLMLPTTHYAWRPRLQLELAEAGLGVLYPTLETTGQVLSTVPGSDMRPYSFRVELPKGAGNCFKIVEQSYPKYKAGFCLPPAGTDRVCDTLAAPERFTAARPALYTAIGPLRQPSKRDWRQMYDNYVVRLQNYVSYHVAVGLSGLLLYTDVIMRRYLGQDPRVTELLRKGSLRFIHWDLPERGHEDTDGQGRPLGYNYDQALFASHALLGLSACGANVMLLLGDMDEYVYLPKPGSKWPAPLGSCMPTRTTPWPGRPSEPITLHELQRIELLSKRVSYKDERHLWLTPGSLSSSTSSSSSTSGKSTAGNGTTAYSFVHPLELYDQAYRQPLASYHGKPVTLPAAGIVAYFVHEGVPTHGTTQLVASSCIVVLHVPNYHGGRRFEHDKRLLRPFKHWMFVKSHHRRPS